MSNTGVPRQIQPRRRASPLPTGACTSGLAVERFPQRHRQRLDHLLTAMLSEDVELCADRCGKASVIRETLSGIARVLDFIGQSFLAGGIITASLTFGFDEAGRVRRIFIMRNPDKLATLRDSLDMQ